MKRMPFNKTAMSGDTVTLRCHALMSRSYGHVQWLKHYKVGDSFLSAHGSPYVTLLQVLSITYPVVLLTYIYTQYV